jgi:hypothetical protein
MVLPSIDFWSCPADSFMMMLARSPCRRAIVVANLMAEPFASNIAGE